MSAPDLSVVIPVYNEEASLPALVSRLAPAGQKGAAVGIFTSLQFLGAFAGATAGGGGAQYFGSSAGFGLCGLLTLSWVLGGWPMSGPGRMIATSTTRSSRLCGRLFGSVCICARLSTWNTPTVSAAWSISKTSGTSSGIRSRSKQAAPSCSVSCSVASAAAGLTRRGLTAS